MLPNVYFYAQYTPDERLDAEALDGGGSEPWVIVRPAVDGAQNFTLGLSVDQARDLARKLFKAAAEVDTLQALADANAPKVVAAP